MVFDIAVLKDGTVGEIRIVELDPPGLGFEITGVEALRQRRYEPADVPRRCEVTLVFELR